jgi:hypothetical protein
MPVAKLENPSREPAGVQGSEVVERRMLEQPPEPDPLTRRLLG